jgi:4-hydroxy-4-methyl-2-oxoglutarate aldolase
MTLEAIAHFDTGTLCESGATALAPGLRPIGAPRRLVGRALTVTCPPGENLMLHRAVARAKPGDVIVGRCGSVEHAYWGEVMTVAALARGVAGLIIDGSVRDVEAMRARDFPVFAAGAALSGPGKRAGGSVGEAIELRGARVHSGDIVVADESGVVVIAEDALADVAARANARTQKERGIIERLGQGATTLELFALPAD